jgi:hypothetical protein
MAGDAVDRPLISEPFGETAGGDHRLAGSRIVLH